MRQFFSRSEQVFQLVTPFSHGVRTCILLGVVAMQLARVGAGCHRVGNRVFRVFSGVFCMSSRRKSVAYSCADCYFRQELVCALKTEQICPTFRPVRREQPVQPQQAQLLDPVGEVAAMTGVEQERVAGGASVVAIGDAQQAAPPPRPTRTQRVAAAAMKSQTSTSVAASTDEAHADAPTPPASPAAGRTNGRSTDRSGRVARRVAQRFPAASQQG